MDTQPLLARVKYTADGLVTAIAQDSETNEVLMIAYMNEATLRQTIETRVMTYWSRSRQKVWVKGESSGHTQEVREIRIDCDGDALLFKVKQNGAAACHTGHRSCFFSRYEGGALIEDGELLFDPASVYGR
jgi:phosphoribosyl-AMP cyclohydrolase